MHPANGIVTIKFCQGKLKINGFCNCNDPPPARPPTKRAQFKITQDSRVKRNLEAMRNA